MKIPGVIALLYIYPLLITANAFSQTQLKIVSAIDNSALPYANITNLTMQQVYSANSRGAFQLNANEGDSIRISYVGYKSKDYVFKMNEKTETIVLSKDISLLKPVIISTCKKTGKIKIKSAKGNGLPAISWSYTSFKGVYGFQFKPSTPGILQSFSFWLTQWHAPASAIPAPFMISFYDIDDSTGLPSNPLPVAPVIYFPTEPGKQTIALDSVRIVVPEEGIYICFQYIMDEKYAWPQKTKWCMPDCKDTTVMQYGIFLSRSEDENALAVIYNYRNDGWTTLKSDKHIIARYEAVLKYCKER
ncbi:MAG: carboxypeptidase-like regulatory domain-containing protein [Ferruginibacter sp.]